MMTMTTVIVMIAMILNVNHGNKDNDGKSAINSKQANNTNSNRNDNYYETDHHVQKDQLNDLKEQLNMIIIIAILISHRKGSSENPFRLLG